MTKQEIIKAEYQGIEVAFTDDAWFDATAAAEKFGKRPVDWIRLDETQAYLSAIAEALGISEPKSLIKAKRNSGTWFHPKLAVRFAQWLDMRFAVWCDMQIDTILRGTHTHFDSRKLRHECASSYKVMSAVLQLTRQMQDKPTATHHYTNEARLINWALTGEFRSVDRDALSDGDMELLAKLEERNTVLMGCGVAYPDRKKLLEQFAFDWRVARVPQLAESH